jgi:hypothetical protein
MSPSAKSLQNIYRTGIFNLGVREVNSATPRLRSPTLALVKVPFAASLPAIAAATS